MTTCLAYIFLISLAIRRLPDHGGDRLWITSFVDGNGLHGPEANPQDQPANQESGKQDYADATKRASYFQWYPEPFFHYSTGVGSIPNVPHPLGSALRGRLHPSIE